MSEIDLPIDWSYVKLSNQNVTSLMKAGGTPKRNVDDYWKDGTIPFVKIKDITHSEKYLYSTEEKITKKGLKNSSAWLVPKNTVLYSMYASYGEPIISKIPVATNQAIIALIPSKKINIDFLYYSLIDIKRKLDKYIRESTQKNLNAKIVKNLKISVPSLYEQRSISKVLGQVDESIHLTNLIIRKTKELKRGVRERLLTQGIKHTDYQETPLGRIPQEWRIAKIGTISDKLNSGITPRGGSENYKDKGVVFIRSQNVLMNKLDFSDVAFITQKMHESMSNSTVYPNDVLLNITGASIGRVSYVPHTVKEANVNQHVCRIRFSENIHPVFMSYFLSSYHGQKQIMRFQAGGTRQGLNYKQLRSIYSPIPSFKEQIKISEILMKFDESIEAENQVKQKYLTLKQGLLSKLLSGEIRLPLGEDGF